MRIIKLHHQILKFLLHEFKRKRTFSQLVRFFLTFITNYSKVILTEYSLALTYIYNSFNPEFTKQQQELKRFNEVKRNLQTALKLLQQVEIQMKKRGLPRQQIRQFFRDFYSRGYVRQDVFDDLMKQIK